ncbi:carboxypeptidase M [Poeciliopsis prolifica]|uniref:carboxypeptidase M n=1 Tax=Poeciliopsis prolifica TaxID=188132 RepID=UPI002413F44D|nr:carboxypeptidase M [Poeciliopsis prolifica]
MSSSLLLLLFLLFLFVPTLMLEFRYHNNREMEQYLVQVSADNPNITHLYSIGKSVKGQQLWVLALGLRPRRHAVGVPEFKYVANMHGNEVVGRVLLLQLIAELVRGYRDKESWSLQLLNSTRIHILPTMNPDGFDEADTNCLLSQGRLNYNGVDLNRGFPDAFVGLRKEQELKEEQREAEVRAVIGWLRSETFVLSANLHGGAMVASYPYDNSNQGSAWTVAPSITPDDDVFVHLAKVYSYNHASMHKGNLCDDSGPFQDGIINGYYWYKLEGGMQDYNYVWAQCLELTLELSCCKFPRPKQLPALWMDNKEALLAYIRQVHLGVKGQVFDGWGMPVQNAVVEVEGRRNICPFRTNQHGEYYRLLLPGNYTFKVSYPGHEVLTETLSIPYGPEQYSAMKHDFKLRRVASATAHSQAQSSPSCNYSLLLDGGAIAAGPARFGPVVAVSLVMVLQSVMD